MQQDHFQRVGIVGLGLIGGSLALAWRRAGFKGEVIGFSRPETLEQARALGAVDRGHAYDELATAVADVDLVVLATPIRRILELLDVLGSDGVRAREGTVVTDVGSTMGAVLDKARLRLTRHFHFIGGHPMAGSEVSGILGADPFLFQNAYYVLSPLEGVPAEITARLAGFIQLTGARVVVIDAETHDRVAAAISHLPQLLAVTLVNHLDGLGDARETAIRLAAGGFRDMTRIASSPYDLWRDILETNQAEIQKAMDRFQSAIEETGARLGAGSLDAAFQKARETRAGIPRDTKGFLHALEELLVVVEDRPGVIAEIATAIASVGVNIKDIEILKVREGEGGTMRLAFEDRASAHRARRIIESLGHAVRLRE